MTRSLRDARILLVDDSENDIELALAAFAERRLGNVVEVARSGQEALGRLACDARDADGRPLPLPDLILLDLKMPGIDGFDVLRELKARPILRRIPVTILTSSREEADRAMSYDAGASSYLVKPVAFEDMLRVAALIEGYWLTINVAPPLDREPGPS